MSSSQKALYTGRTRTSGGRDGASRSFDGRLDVRLSSPGSTGSGTNPEQLLAAAWSASFISAIRYEAENAALPPPPVTVDAEVDLARCNGTHRLRARLNVSLLSTERATAQALVDAAYRTCPFCKATRGNVDVEINIV
jgi:osmotically inducible protein OsmC